MEVTGEAMTVHDQAMDAGQVLALLEQEGQDMDRVLQRLGELRGGMERLLSVQQLPQ